MKFIKFKKQKKYVVLGFSNNNINFEFAKPNIKKPKNQKPKKKPNFFSCTFFFFFFFF